jgi:hypothetical protein
VIDGEDLRGLCTNVNFTLAVHAPVRLQLRSVNLPRSCLAFHQPLRSKVRSRLYA